MDSILSDIPEREKIIYRKAWFRNLWGVLHEEIVFGMR